MFAQIQRLESAARLAMAMGDDLRDGDPLPPAPNYGPFGYFRLGILVMAVAVGGMLLASLL